MIIHKETYLKVIDTRHEQYELSSEFAFKKMKKANVVIRHGKET
jgi:hypothetical protein